MHAVFATSQNPSPWLYLKTEILACSKILYYEPLYHYSILPSVYFSTQLLLRTSILFYFTTYNNE